jgi:hypothetical protein
MNDSITKRVSHRFKGSNALEKPIESKDWYGVQKGETIGVDED